MPRWLAGTLLCGLSAIGFLFASLQLPEVESTQVGAVLMLGATLLCMYAAPPR